MSEPVKKDLLSLGPFYSQEGGKCKETFSLVQGSYADGAQEKSAGWVLKQVQLHLTTQSAQSVFVVRLLLA